MVGIFTVEVHVEGKERGFLLQKQMGYCKIKNYVIHLLSGLVFSVYLWDRRIKR